MKWPRKVLWVPVALSLVGPVAWACSHNYISYLFHGGEHYAETMLPTLFSAEVQRILGAEAVQRIAPEPTYHESDRSQTRYEQSAARDLADLAEAVAGRDDADAVAAAHQRVRTAITDHYREWQAQVEDAWYDAYRSVADIPPPEPLDMAPYEEALEAIPAEFAHYLRGAAAYHARNWDDAIGQFEAVLALPADKRRYRSIWAAFMLGKAWTEADPAQARPYFELTRQLAEEGFHDSLGLAPASMGWQAHAELDAKDHLAAMHHYAEAVGDKVENLRRTCSAALAAETVDPRLVEDDLARRLITAWVTSHKGSADKADKWLSAIDAYRPDGVVEEADHLAIACYNRGDMESARRWLAHCAPDEPFAEWLKAKLLLHEGQFDEAEQQLKRAAAIMPDNDEWNISLPSYSELTVYGAARAVDHVNGDLGFVATRNGNYATALDAFITARDREDALRIAEMVMSIDELQAFVDSEAQTDTAEDAANRGGGFGWYSGIDRDTLSWVLARRYARAGEWETAASFYRDADSQVPGSRSRDHEYLHELALSVHDWTATAADTGKPNDARAEALMRIGMTIREEGPALYCPILIPDPDPFNGDAPGFPADFADRLRAHQANYPHMNHFKWAAADYMWEAAVLLPDNNVTNAEALFTGGSYIKYKDPEAADEFYKALVRENPNLAIAIEADKLRWFPETFTDEVVYEPLPAPWYGRKLYLARAAAVVLGLAAWIGVVVWLRRQSWT